MVDRAMVSNKDSGPTTVAVNEGKRAPKRDGRGASFTPVEGERPASQHEPRRFDTHRVRLQVRTRHRKMSDRVAQGFRFDSRRAPFHRHLTVVGVEPAP